MSNLRRTILVLTLGCGCVGSSLRAATDITGTTVGIATLAALANSDALISAAFTRPPVYTGAIAALSGAVITVNSNPAWATNSFVQSLPTQTDAYYVQFKTGAAAGRYYTVTANSGSTLTIDWNGELPAAAVGDCLLVIPYWTLATLYPASSAGVSFVASTSSTVHGTEILFPDVTSVGINLPAAATYYFFNGSWRKVGQDPTVVYDNTVIGADSYVILRNHAGATNVTLYGSVNSGSISTILNAQGGSVKQDNSVALRFGGTVTLAASNLVGSGAFRISTSSLIHTDELYVYNNAATGMNKPASATYYYFNGAWRKVGAAVTANFGGDLVFTPGAGVIIRKAGTGGAAAGSYWIYTANGF